MCVLQAATEVVLESEGELRHRNDANDGRKSRGIDIAMVLRFSRTADKERF